MTLAVIVGHYSAAQERVLALLRFGRYVRASCHFPHAGVSRGYTVPWNVTWVIQPVTIELPGVGVVKRRDTDSIAPARGSAALLFDLSRIVLANVRV